MCFSKNEPRPFGVPDQVKLALFEPIASHFGHSKVTKNHKKSQKKALKMVVLGPKISQKWIKNVLFQRYFWTIWGAQTSGMGPF